MPNDVISGLAPIQTEGDRNCFPRTISYLLSKSQAMYTELRVHIKMEKDEGTPVKSKEIMKRQTYVRTKMKLMKARQIILKHNQKGSVKVDSVPQKEQKQSEGGDKSDLSEMSSLHMQVETMIKQGKTDADSIHKINTLKKAYLQC